MRNIKEQISKGFGFGFGFFLFFGLVSSIFAAGFHFADEVLPGTFLGNYTFDGNINVNGNIQNKGIATAWVNFDGSDCSYTGNTCLIGDSHNIANVTRISQGLYDIYFENIMDNHNYNLLSMTGSNTAYLEDGYGFTANLAMNYTNPTKKTISVFRVGVGVGNGGESNMISDIFITIFGGK